MNKVTSAELKKHKASAELKKHKASAELKKRDALVDCPPLSKNK